ncbi:hypothetical protein AMECASPLE_020886 [Ameca splendens]|uniref:Uncharacterized protein n=1 Tax=Ameca splendens TaxID=208324 RepID=A0ABV0Y3N0_9TELE
MAHCDSPVMNHFSLQMLHPSPGCFFFFFFHATVICQRRLVKCFIMTLLKAKTVTLRHESQAAIVNAFSEAFLLWAHTESLTFIFLSQEKEEKASQESSEEEEEEDQ